ncbi:MAG: histidine kinase, partial [Acidobacteriota bacterium]
SAIGASLARLVPMTAVSLVLDPYRPVPTESSFGAEYAAQIPQWLPMDVALYAVILLAAEAFEAREQVHRDRLRAARLENELTAAELRALRLELQPHFLFNTMNAVVSLIRSGAAERAERMLLGLSDLLRTTLDGRRRPLVPLAEEVATTDLYLDIQRVRFGDRLRFAWRLEPGIERAAVPALLLQPLVENAVRHAVEAGDGEGSIEVAAARQGDALSISVEDSGPREGESQPEADLGTDHSTPRRERGSGLGLDNVRARLAALYGGAWTLELERRPHGGTRVLMRFPWTLMEESGA